MITKREGLILYWCEGDKRHKGIFKVAVTAADAKLLRLFVEWLELHYGVARQNIRLRLHIWEDSDEAICKAYWSEKLKIPADNFTKSDVRKSGKNKKYPHGICRASLDDKNLFNRISAEIEESF